MTFRSMVAVILLLNPNGQMLNQQCSGDDFPCATNAQHFIKL